MPENYYQTQREQAAAFFVKHQGKFTKGYTAHRFGISTDALQYELDTLAAEPVTDKARTMLPNVYTHAAIVINLPEVDIVPATSEDAALEYLRGRAAYWDERTSVPELDLKTATLEQLNLLFSDGDPSPDCLVTIGTFEKPYSQSAFSPTHDWHWRDTDGCLVAGEDQEYILLPSPLVTIKLEHKALISAAPDLLASCKAILREWNAASTNQEIVSRIGSLLPELRVALAKAYQIEIED